MLVALLGVLGISTPVAAAMALGYRIVSTLPLGVGGVISYAWLSARLPEGRGDGLKRAMDGSPLEDLDEPRGPRSVSAGTVAAVVVLIGGLCAATIVIGREARRTGLGLAHPGVPWLALYGLFFGIGSLVLAVTEGAAGPAAYVGGAAAAFAGGLWVSTAVARARAPTPSDARRPADARSQPGPTAARPTCAPAIAELLAIASIALIVPVLLRTGIPFLTQDITGSRAELVGLVIQPMRVALPALAVAWLLRARLASSG